MSCSFPPTQKWSLTQRLEIERPFEAFQDVLHAPGGANEKLRPAPNGVDIRGDLVPADQEVRGAVRERLAERLGHFEDLAAELARRRDDDGADLMLLQWALEPPQHLNDRDDKRQRLPRPSAGVHGHVLVLQEQWNGHLLRRAAEQA